MTCALLTGATGFVGANLVEALSARGWRVRALHRPTSSLKALAGLTFEAALGDVLDLDSLRRAMAGVDVVFHVAAVADYWRSDATHLMRVNVDGTRSVLQAALERNVQRVVFTSSCAALGKPLFGHTLDERATFNMKPTEFLYGYSKHVAEQVCHEFIAKGLDVVIVNPAVVIGPRDVNLISGSLIVEIARRGGLPILPPGGVSVIDVADVCAGHIAAAEQGRTGERYILTSENLWYEQLFTEIAALLQVEPPRWRVPAPVLRLAGACVDWLRQRWNVKLPLNGEQVRFAAETFWFDNRKARTELGLQPAPVRVALQRAYDWFRAEGYL
ncbi:MAG: SDR family oxidoreductase [Thermoflexales bacterium]